MSKVNIKNPVINSSFEELQRPFKFKARGITEEITDSRRRSESFMPFPKPKKQLAEAQNTIRFWDNSQAKTYC